MCDCFHFCYRRDWNMHCYEQYFQQHRAITQWVQDVHRYAENQVAPHRYVNDQPYTSRMTEVNMYDSFHHSRQRDWNRHFHEQYLQQHRVMTQWVEDIHRYAENQAAPQMIVNDQPFNTSRKTEVRPPASCHSASSSTKPANNKFSRKKDMHHIHKKPDDDYKAYRDHDDTEESASDECDDTEESASVECDDTEESESDEYESDRSDIIGSEDELYFDPGSLLDIRESKGSTSEESESEETDSFDVLDEFKEEFEYVQLDRFGNMPENRKGRSGIPDAKKDMIDAREMAKLCYGEKGRNILGFETVMVSKFNHFCDFHQPHIWPVLPLRL